MRITEASERIRELRSEATKWEREARILEGVGGLDPAARVRREEADRLRGEADRLRPAWRLENLKGYQVTKTKTTAKGQTRRYTYYHASWRDRGRVVSVYLGSTRRITEEAALMKARAMKADALEL